MLVRCTFICFLILATSCSENPGIKPGVVNEMVMPAGMSIAATTHDGTISVTAGEGFKRSYTWDGATRSVTLWPRWDRWYGSLGAYFPGPGEHWKDNHGITRGVLEEGQQHFETVQEAMAWIVSNGTGCVYRNDGLMVCWGRTLERKQLNVSVWQIYVAGEKPTRLAGSNDDKIIVSEGKKT
jgi:hypothetical protein